MANQTSEQRRGEATGPEFPEDTFDRMFGVDDKRPGKCEQHGEFVDVHFSGEKRMPEGWRGCPQCCDEQAKAKQEAESERHQDELVRERVERMVQKAGIPPRFAGKSFDSYQPVNAKAKSHLAKIREYAELVSGKEHKGRCLLMLGKLGNGKTHLGCALLEQVIRNTMQPCRYWTFAQLVRQVKGSFSNYADYSEQDVYTQFARPRVVVLDEVGMQNFTEFEQAVAYEAINHRYLAEKPTVLITNLQAKDLPLCIGERSVDRLRENGGRALDFDWSSYRSGGDS